MFTLIFFAVSKDSRDGIYGGEFLGRKELTFHPGNSMFYWTVTIQFFHNSGSPSTPRYNSVLGYSLFMRYYRLLMESFLSRALFILHVFHRRPCYHLEDRKGRIFCLLVVVEVEEEEYPRSLVFEG